MPRRRTRRRAARVVAVAAAGVAVVAFLVWHGMMQPNQPSRARFPVRGVDVSHHQGMIDWARLRADGAEFAYLKATEGAGWRDSTFVRNRAGALRAGVVTGAYHYFTFCAPGAAQARNFLAAAPPLPGPALPPAVDLELGGNCAARPHPDSLAAELRAFLAPVEAAYGRAAVLYVTRELYDRYLAGRPAANPLWLRSLLGEPRYGGRWVIWQYAARGRMDGVETYVDLNVFNGTRAEFEAWTRAR
ncbi:MAG TPA: GH25 family lysozyme [Longimicrobiaceae bacterium]